MRRTLSASVVLALAAGFLGAGASAAQAATAGAKAPAPGTRAAAGAQPRAAVAAAVSTVQWSACTDGLEAYGLQCGSVTVPMDHADPAGPTVTIALSRLPHDPSLPYQGSMLVNPGGPGGEGRIWAILGNYVPDDVGRQYDWIGFDPRGVGASTPRLSCDPDYAGYARPDYVPTDPADEQAWLAKAQAYAAACAANGGELLQHMRTTDVAQDVDDIRRALGDEQLNWYGFSYGTYIGQVYATMYPERVRRMVLDGVVDPRDVWYQANLNQDVAFDRAFDEFFAWIAKYDSTYHLGTTPAAVEQAYYDARASLHGDPADGKLGPSEFDDALLNAGYAQFLWPELAQALSDLVVHGDASGLLAEYPGPGDDNGFAVYSATECTDARWPTNWNKWHNDATRYYRKAPLLTWGNVWFNAQCAFWPVAGSQPVHVTGKGAPPILLISQTLDAATPYAGAIEVRKLFKDSVLVAEPGGTTHAGSLSGNECTDGVIAQYLATGALPARQPGNKADVLCQPLPQPVPDEATAATASSGSGASRAVLSRRVLLPQR